MADEGKKSTADQFGEDVGRQLKVDAKDLLAASDALAEYARQVNNTFTQGRQRISELSTALADATPGVRRLGGDIGDVADIIGKVAAESRRNVIANTEDVEKLYAANKVLGLGAETLAKNFLNIGAGIETIPETLEESVQYIQSIGGNAKAVMGDVTDNMEQMNRYQFEGGVQGLTKMAAQASMLRFDMSNTFALAEKVLDPDKAVEVASAFQRLGVSAGNLADPFQLMNQSINDPSGLQDSLANVSKQFTYFDEKTKTFKINPQGVLTLREMESQAGLAQGSLSKMGLAAAELDKRLEDVGKAGIQFASEEDKQYLANIATMSKGGDYIVKVKNDFGTQVDKKLSEVTQDEFDKLIEEQKNQPKTLEDIARAQMKTSDVVAGDVAAIRAKVVGGLVSAGPLLETREGIRRGATTLTGGLSNMGTTKDVRSEVEKGIGDLGTLLSDLKNKDMSTTDALSKYLEKAGTQLGSIEEKFKQSLTKTAEEIRANTGDKTAVERLMKEGYDYILGKAESNAAKEQRAAGNQPISSLLEGSRSQQLQQATSSNYAGQVGGQKSQVEMMGGIKIDINFTGGASELTAAQKEQITKMFSDKMNSIDMRQYMYGTTTKQNPTKSDSQYNY